SPDMDDQVPLFHCEVSHAARPSTNASAPRHFSTCTRQEFGLMLLVPAVWGRSGVSIFMQPPISTGSPSISMSLNSALASYDLTTPAVTSGETSAAQITAPRSL